MSSKYSVSLEKVIRDHSLEALYLPKAASDLYISSYDVNRPGLILRATTIILIQAACSS